MFWSEARKSYRALHKKNLGAKALFGHLGFNGDHPLARLNRDCRRHSWVGMYCPPLARAISIWRSWRLGLSIVVERWPDGSHRIGSGMLHEVTK